MKSNFKAFISSNYKKIEQIIRRNCWKRGLQFSIDLFNDVILRCLEKAPNNINYTGYIITSYNRAWLNSIKSCAGNPQTEEYIIDQPLFKIDLDIIYDDIKNNFGEELMEMFKRWLSGWSVKEIEEMAGKNGLTYKFKKIRDFIKEKYNGV